MKEALAQDELRLLRTRLTSLETEIVRPMVPRQTPNKHDVGAQVDSWDASAIELQGLRQENEFLSAAAAKLRDKLSRSREGHQRALQMLAQAETRATEGQLRVIERPCTPEEVRRQINQLEAVYAGEILLLNAQLEEARRSAADFKSSLAAANTAELLRAQEDAAHAWLRAQDKDWELRRVRMEAEAWRELAPGSALERQKAGDYDQVAAENVRLARVCQQMEEASQQQRLLLEKQLANARQRALNMQDLVGAVERLKTDLRARENELCAMTAQTQELKLQESSQSADRKVFMRLCGHFLATLVEIGLMTQYAELISRSEFICTYFPELLSDLAKLPAKAVGEEEVPSREAGGSPPPQKSDAPPEPNEHFAATIRKCNRFRCFCSASRTASPERHRLYLYSGIAHSPLK